MLERARVVLFRAPRADDSYARHLNAAGFEPVHRPILEYRPKNQLALQDALRHPDDYSGLVITSERGAERVLATDSWQPWVRKPLYALGPRTRSILEQSGFGPLGPIAQTGRDLADAIRTLHRDARPLLFPCSSSRRDELPDALKSASIPLFELPVYDTIGAIPSEIEHEDPPEWAVFFSPSGVEAACEFIASSWTMVRRAAIGPTTAAALEAAGIPANAVADSPDPEALVRAILGG